MARIPARERVLIVGVAPKGMPRGVAEDQLDELERQVNISNQNVKVFEAQYEQSLALVREARSQLFPAAGVSFRYTVAGLGSLD